MQLISYRCINSPKTSIRCAKKGLEMIQMSNDIELVEQTYKRYFTKQKIYIASRTAQILDQPNRGQNIQ